MVVVLEGSGAMVVVLEGSGAMVVVLEGRSREHEKPETKSTPIVLRNARIGRKCGHVLHGAQRLPFREGYTYLVVVAFVSGMLGYGNSASADDFTNLTVQSKSSRRIVDG
jgi:hypothetical protein